jgi:hypothetical protein
MAARYQNITSVFTVFFNPNKKRFGSLRNVTEKPRLNGYKFLNKKEAVALPHYTFWSCGQ